MNIQDRKVLIIRHGETQWNLQGKLQGRLDTPLTLNGVRQAMAIAVQHKSFIQETQDIQFWVSPLGRAKQTASILADLWEVPFSYFKEIPALAERGYGCWEGLSQEEIKATRAQEFESNSRDPWNFAMEGGESRAKLANRLHEWVEELSADSLHVAITHSGCLRSLRGLYTGVSLDVQLGYNEPQTTAVLLCEGREELIDVPSAVLTDFGCQGRGRTVWI